jgi:glycosyltransferase involved in cell wall biosynthesis
MKLVYASNQRLPTDKAYGLQIAAMCRAFAAQGVDVQLVAPSRRGAQGTDVKEYYNLAENIQFKRLWGPDFHLPGMLDRIAFWFVQGCSALIMGLYVGWNRTDIVYCREELVALVASLVGRRVVLELHSFSFRRRPLYLLLRVLGVRIVCITSALCSQMEKIGFPADRILVASDGVDLDLFSHLPDRAQARREVHLSADIPVVLYAGHLYSWKGADVLAAAAPHIDGAVVLVGGTQADHARYMSQYGSTANLMLVGHRPHAEIPRWLRAADIVVLPNRRDAGISEHYTSPLKMFEYMASGTPIIASDLPSIREVLNASNAMLVRPDDSAVLVEAIRSLLADPSHATDLAEQALRDVRQYTWQSRAALILDYFRFRK